MHQSFEIMHPANLGGGQNGLWLAWRKSDAAEAPEVYPHNAKPIIQPRSAGRVRSFDFINNLAVVECD